MKMILRVNLKKKILRPSRETRKIFLFLKSTLSYIQSIYKHKRKSIVNTSSTVIHGSQSPQKDMKSKCKSKAQKSRTVICE